jgi:hypothetical protein
MTCGGKKSHLRPFSRLGTLSLVVVKVPGIADLTLLLRQRSVALNHGSHVTSGDH